MMWWGKLLAVFILLIPGFVPRPVCAAFSITQVSPLTINSPDDVVTISASASGLQNSTQYFQGAFTKENESPSYFGLTKNNSDQWFQYKSSPELGDLQSYFYSFTPVAGSWSGQIQVKIDPNSSGFKGSGNYKLKLLKHITGSGSDSDPVTVMVNYSLPDSSNNPDNSSTPKINYQLPEKLYIGKEFRVGVELKDFDKNNDYYLKVRGGQDDGSLTKLQTKNDQSFLSDNDSWSSFPVIKTSDDGKWNGEIYARLNEDKPTGKYKLQIKVRKKDTDKYFESEIKEADFLSNLGTSSASSGSGTTTTTRTTTGSSTQAAVRRAVLAASTSADTSIDDTLLAQNTINEAANEPENSKEVEELVQDENLSRISMIMIVLGLIFLGGAGIYFIRQRR